MEVRVKELEDSNFKCQVLREKCGNDLVGAQSEVNSLKMQLTSLTNNQATLTDQLNSASSRSKICESQLSDCNAQKLVLTQRVGSLEESDKALQALRSDYKQLQLSENTLRINYENCSKSLNSANNVSEQCRLNFNDLSAKFNLKENEYANQISKLKNDAEKLLIEIRNLNSSLEQSRKQEELCKTNLAQCNNSNANFADEIKNIAASLRECRTGDDKLAGCKLELHTEKLASQVKDNQLAEIRKQLEEARNATANCQGLLQSLQQATKKLESNNLQLVSKFDALRNDLLICNNNHMTESNDWNLQIRNLRAQLAESNKNLEICRNDYTSLQKMFASVNSEFDVCKDKNKSLNLQILKLEQSSGSLLKLQQELDRNMQLVASLQKENAELGKFRSLHGQCQAQINSLTLSFNSQLQTCSRDLINAQSNLQNSSNKLSSLESQIKVLNEKLSILNARNQSLSEEKRNLLYKLSTCEYSLKDFEGRSSSFAVCTSDLGRVREQLKTLQAAAEVLEKEKSQLESKLQITTSQLSQMTSNYRYLVTQVELGNNSKKSMVIRNRTINVDINDGEKSSKAKMVGSENPSDSEKK